MRQEVLVDARRQAHVRGRPGPPVKGWRGEVLAAGLEVEAELAQHLHREVPLRIPRVVLAHHRVVGLRRVEHPLGERHELRPQPVSSGSSSAVVMPGSNASSIAS